jgi:DNA repair exonuclease SbcCD nuclease subunit
MKVLFFGDPHIQISNLEESHKLLQFVLDQSKNVDRLVILGDLFHNHANVRVEVQHFWSKWFHKLDKEVETFVLVGNHDQIGNYSTTISSLSIFNQIEYNRVYFIHSPIHYDNIFGFMSYINDKQEFIKEANRLVDEGAKVLVVHQDIDGAQYENGFYCANGVKQEELNCDLIIGGHIHKRSRFGKVILPGTARWLTAADKNEPKGLWLAEFNDEGKIVQEEFLDTSHVCTPIYAYEYKEGGEEPVIPVGSRSSVELIGSSEWVSKQKVKFKGKASISTKITDKEKPKNRKTGNSLQHFITNTFDVTTGIDKNKLVNFMKEMEIL